MERTTLIVALQNPYIETRWKPLKDPSFDNYPYAAGEPIVATPPGIDLNILTVQYAQSPFKSPPRSRQELKNAKLCCLFSAGSCSLKFRACVGLGAFGNRPKKPRNLDPNPSKPKTPHTSGETSSMVKAAASAASASARRRSAVAMESQCV